MTDQEPRRVSKIVLTFGKTQATIGVFALECDPFFVPIVFAQGDDALPPLEQVLDYLPLALQAAQNRWREQARNPTYDRPAPQVQPTTGRRGTAQSGQQTLRRSGPQQQSLL